MEINLHKTPPTHEDIEMTKQRIMDRKLYSTQGMGHSSIIVDLLRIPFVAVESAYLFVTQEYTLQKLSYVCRDLDVDYSYNKVVEHYINQVKLMNRDLLDIEVSMLKNKLNNHSSGWTNSSDKVVF